MNNKIKFIITIIILNIISIESSAWLHISNDTDNTIEIKIHGFVENINKQSLSRYNVEPYNTRFIDLGNTTIQDITFKSISGSAKNQELIMKTDNKFRTRAFMIKNKKLFFDQAGNETNPALLNIVNKKNQLKAKEITQEFVVFERGPKEAERIAFRK